MEYFTGGTLIYSFIITIYIVVFKEKTCKWLVEVPKSQIVINYPVDIIGATLSVTSAVQSWRRRNDSDRIMTRHSWCKIISWRSNVRTVWDVLFKIFVLSRYISLHDLCHLCNLQFCIKLYIAIYKKIVWN